MKTIRSHMCNPAVSQRSHKAGCTERPFEPEVIEEETLPVVFDARSDAPIDTLALVVGTPDWNKAVARMGCRPTLQAKVMWAEHRKWNDSIIVGSQTGTDFRSQQGDEEPKTA